MPTKKKPIRKRAAVSTEYLIETLASVSAALSSIDKQDSAKTEALSALSENINLMSEMLKHIHAQGGRESDRILQLENQIRILHTEIKKDEDVKEIKYALQQMSANLLELKTIEKTRSGIDEKPAERKKWKLFTVLHDVLGGLNHLKSILVIVLLIAMLITSVIFGPDAVGVLIDLVKKMVS